MIRKSRDDDVVLTSDLLNKTDPQVQRFSQSTNVRVLSSEKPSMNYMLTNERKASIEREASIQQSIQEKLSTSTGNNMLSESLNTAQLKGMFGSKMLRQKNLNISSIVGHDREKQSLSGFDSSTG